MSFAYKVSRGSDWLARTLLGLGLSSSLAIGSVSSAMAQGAPGGDDPGPAPEQEGGGMRHWHGGGGHPMLSRETIDGPATPALLHDSIGLSEDQLTRYARLYSNYMAETRPSRDSLRPSIQAMHNDLEEGDRSAARGRHDAIEKQSQDLAKRDKDFEKVLKQGLTKDQQKRYNKWKEAREKAKKSERQHHRDGRPHASNL